MTFGPGLGGGPSEGASVVGSPVEPEEDVGVVNDQATADVMRLPAASFTPLTLAVKVVPGARAALGVNVAV